MEYLRDLKIKLRCLKKTISGARLTCELLLAVIIEVFLKFTINIIYTTNTTYNTNINYSAYITYLHHLQYTYLHHLQY